MKNKGGEDEGSEFTMKKELKKKGREWRMKEGKREKVSKQNKELMRECGCD